MLQYRPVPVAAPPLWVGVRQPARPYAPSSAGSSGRSGAVRQPRPSDAAPESKARSRSSRVRRRLLAAAAARIESTPEYRRSLAALQRLVTSFRKELNGALDERWLAVEEALLEHAARVNEAYFWEGVAAAGQRAARARPENAAIASLAELIAWLATR